MPPGEVRLQFSLRDGRLVLSQFEAYDQFGRLYLTRALMSSGRYSLRHLTRNVPPDASPLMRRSDKAARSERPRHFLFEGDSVLLPQVESRHDRSSDDAVSSDFDISPFAQEYWGVASYSEQNVKRMLREMSYLGPLREPLRRVYELSGDPPRDVGTRGEFAPEVIFLNKSLLDETRTWLRFFGLGRSLRPTTGRDDTFSLYFPAGGGRPSVNVADVGFGASQILPMIVQGVSAATDHLLAMEQPEIHLNPRLQSRIADFLAFMAASKKAVLVETHSEHLLLRIRTLIAKGAINEEDVALYFVDRAKGTSVIRSIPINNGGFIKHSDWPRGFFQDSVRESLALATEQNKGARDAR